MRRLLIFVLLLAGCGPRIAELHQVAWDQFTVSEVEPDQPPPAVSVPAGASDAVKFEALVAEFRRRLDQAKLPGGAVAVVIDGKLAFSTGIGVKRAGETAPVTSKTLFRLASTSKVITAIAVHKLVEQGLLDTLDRSVPSLAPWFTRRAGDDVAGVTVDRLLAHTAAIPDDNTVRCPPPARLRDFFTAQPQAPLLAPPGVVWNYSNANYLLLGALVEELSGRSFADYVQTQVLSPAGMTTATLDVAAAATGDFAFGHDVKGGLLQDNLYDCATLHPAGGVVASVDDFAHLMESLMAGTVLTPSSVESLFRPRIANQQQPGRGYAAGVFTVDYQGLPLVMHPGGMPGYAAFFAMVPSRKFGIVALVNADGAQPALATAAVDLFLNLPATTPPNRHTPPSTWSDYEGVYEDPAGVLETFTVSLHDDRLRLEYPRQLQAPPEAYTGVFWRNAQNHVDYFVTRAGVARRR